MTIRLTAVLAILLLAMSAEAQEAPRLQLPMSCAINVDCFVQTYFDHDPGEGISDHACGQLTRQKHKGIDIRIVDHVDMREGVPVLAAAAGTVWRTRDGIEDVNVNEIGGQEVVNEYGLGNTVLIDHGGGWITYYGHMLKGSVAVKEGEKVEAGQQIGLVGLSGLTNFPHLHFMVGLKKKLIDPFTGTGDKDPLVCGDTGQALWDDATLAALNYRPSGVIVTGFADAEIGDQAILDRTYSAPDADSRAIVFFAYYYGQHAGDRAVIRLTGPDGKVIAEADKTVERDRTLALRYIGDKASAGLATGSYRGEFQLFRQIDGQETLVASAAQGLEIR